jgi:ribosomal protein S14
VAKKLESIPKTRAYKLSFQNFLNADSCIRGKAKKLEFEKKILFYLLNKEVVVLAGKEQANGRHTLTSIRRFCTLTGRFRGVKSKLKISRHSVRSLGIQGYLVGLKKRSW